MYKKMYKINYTSFLNCNKRLTIYSAICRYLKIIMHIQYLNSSRYFSRIIYKANYYYSHKTVVFMWVFLYLFLHGYLLYVPICLVPTNNKIVGSILCLYIEYALKKIARYYLKCIVSIKYVNISQFFYYNINENRGIKSERNCLIIKYFLIAYWYIF